MGREIRRFFTEDERKIILRKTNGLCAHCGKKLNTDSMTVDHVYPVDKGGINDEYNLLPLCESCNAEKSNFVYEIEAWYKYIDDSEFDKFEMYNLLLDVIESYHTNVVSRKIVWNNENDRKDFEKFWNQFTEYKKLERIDLNEYKRLREILFVMEDISYLKKTGQDMKELRGYYRDRMKQIGGLRKFKNSVKHIGGKWKTRRRMSA